MRISIVVAASANNVIGVNGQLPWRLPEDLQHFKQITMGKPMIMGRTTFESIGRALPGRQSIVLSRRTGYEAAGCDVVDKSGAWLNYGEIRLGQGRENAKKFLSENKDLCEEIKQKVLVAKGLIIETDD